MDVVDCGIRGSEMQFVDFELASGEAVIREAASIPFSRLRLAYVGGHAPARRVER